MYPRPATRAERPPLPEFAPVPRKTNRHDGWTPARQKAFIEALADTGSVRRAATMVNMSQANAYALRRAPGADGLRRAWDVALDYGLMRLKDIAFERAIEGEMIPVFRGDKLLGFRRKRNDALLMFCLRHYGQDAGGRRTTINYFSTRASASAAGDAAGAQASTTTMRTVISGDGTGGDTALRDDRAAAALLGFEGDTLDAEAEAAIAAALADNAARRAAADAAIDAGGEACTDELMEDTDEHFVPIYKGSAYRGELLPPVGLETVEEWSEE